MTDRRDDEERDAFERAMADVEPIEPSRRQHSRMRRIRDARHRNRPPEFELTRHGQRIEGRRTDIEEKRLVGLERGEIRPANRLDLHGMSEEVARQEVYRFVRQSRASGLACVALIHGRGLRSPAGPVLRESLSRWLTQLPLSRFVEAFIAAPPDLGGDGVMLVLLTSRN